MPKAVASKRSVTLAQGFTASSGAFGIKPSGKPDMTLIAAEGLCSAAGVFTKSQCPGAPVIVGKQHLRSGTARGIIVNAGVANVMTGEQGLKDAKAMCAAVAKQLDCSASAIVPSSTGVIGPRLPMDRIHRGIETLAASLKAGPKADQASAHAILTTDLVEKSATARVTLGKTAATLGGIAKGSGMIQPNMATMLSFITTDAAIDPKLLRAALQHATARSFNRISVDHDTSTSDMVIVLASGRAGGRPIATTGKSFDAFQGALTNLCASLAEQVVRDGEGATKVYRVTVTNARSMADADKVGYAITGSPLVKSAVHGGDPNWGRLVMAVGRSGAKVDPARLSLKIGPVTVCKKGEPATLSKQDRTRLNRHMGNKDVEMTVDLGWDDGGTGRVKTAEPATWLGCDLSAQYVRINAEYTT